MKANVSNEMVDKFEELNLMFISSTEKLLGEAANPDKKKENFFQKIYKIKSKIVRKEDPC